MHFFRHFFTCLCSEEERAEWVKSLAVQNLMSFDDHRDSTLTWGELCMNYSLVPRLFGGRKERARNRLFVHARNTPDILGNHDNSHNLFVLITSCSVVQLDLYGLGMRL